MRINPILKNEMKLGSRNMRLSWLIMIYNGILLMVSGIYLFALIEPSKSGYMVDYGAILSLYVVLCCVQYAMIFMLVPALTAGAIAGERTRQTLDLLLVTNMKPSQIIIGKLMTSIASVLMLAISSFPVIALVFVYGGIAAWEVLVFFFLLCISALFIGSIGIFFSTFCRRTTSAVILSYIAASFLLLGTFMIEIIIFILSGFGEKGYSVGNAIYALLLNPAVTFYGMINRQVGNGMAISNICRQFGVELSDAFLSGWINMSITIQLLLAAGLLFLSVRMLDPYTKKKQD